VRETGNPGRLKLTHEQTLYLRMRGQHLLPEYSQASGYDVAAHFARLTGGLQAQDLFAATLGVRVRAPGSTLDEVEKSRLADRSVVWTWLMRGTLHLVPADDLDWLLAVFGPSLIAGTARRREEIGLSQEVHGPALEVVLDKLATSGPATREELSQVLAAAGIPNGYAIERYLLFCAALEGRICFGPDRGSAPGTGPTFTLLEDWLRRPISRPGPDELREARVRLLQRYLDAFAPATLADFSTWAGLNVRDVRDAWEAVSADLVEVEVAGKPAYVPEQRMEELDARLPFPVLRLLPAFDTYILGHRSRELIDNGRYAERLRGGGMLPATVLRNGRIGGTWQTNRKGRRFAIKLEPFEELAPEEQAEAEKEIADIERFVGASSS
jgi:hypothetical protein